MPIALPTSQLLELSGPDALHFAHAQFANDVLALQPGHWQWNAWLSAQGRVRWFFALLRDTQERLVLVLRGGEAESMRAELARFVFRAKVSLRACDELQAYGCDEAATFAALGACPERDVLAVRDGSMALRLPFGARWLLVAAQAPAALVRDDTATAQWLLDDIHAGLPLLPRELQDQFLPQWLGLERFAAISVSKGCYPGQEVMARLHFKGGNKRWLYRITFGCERLPEPGTRLTTERADGAIVVTAAFAQTHRAEALAVLSDGAASGRLTDGAGALYDIQVISRFA